MTDVVLAASGLVLSALPAGLFARNLKAYAPPPLPVTGKRTSVSVLIPARNEEQTIAEAVKCALASREVDVEVVVLDDASTDATAAAVRELSSEDQRVRLIEAPPLPDGWCGKQHACWVLARAARFDLLCFVDADVRLEPDGLARLAAFQQESGAALVSGFPRQETLTWLEVMLLPFMHFLLLGFLPIDRMRNDSQPALGAGCGQLFLADRAGYEKSGGHGAIRSSLHDGLTLPKAFRRAGLMTDLCDATTVARCRMYRGAAEVWRGLSKNASEGIAAPARIVPFTLLLGGGQILPTLLVVGGLTGFVSPIAAYIAAAAVICGHLPRFMAVRRFRQPQASAWLHVPGMVLLLALQWMAALRALRGRPAEWKGRRYTGGTSAERGPAPLATRAGGNG